MHIRFSLQICRVFLLFTCYGVLSAVCLTVAVAQLPQEITFNRDVRPILSDHCFACHGFDEQKRESGLRLDNEEGHAVIVPHRPEASELWARVTSDDDDAIMPPKEFHKPLTDRQKQIVKRWIEQGAIYEDHWSFIPPSKPKVPAVSGVANPIDAFIQQTLQAENLTPAPEADRVALIRRVTLDLTGLPPTPEEVAEFIADPADEAYSRLIDRLQSRATYGEHMARYWLDLARYADTHGLHLDNERSMWPYRDWVIRAINDNLSFDKFTRWQLAGDLLPNPTTDQLIASGFNRCNVTTSEGGSINEEMIFRYAVDRTSTTAEVWMGLTAGCAVCHDHKFDPLSTKEFYSMYAFFHSAADPAMDGNKIDTPPILKLTREEDQTRLAALRQKIADVESTISQQLANLDYLDPATVTPRPPKKTVEEVWFEDGFPPGVKPESSGGPPLKLVDKDNGLVFSGDKAITRTARQTIAQDYFPTGGDFTVPGGKFFVHCFLDPEDPPEAIMIQFHTQSWKNRAVWGAPEKIGFGSPNTTEKVHMGQLPQTGQWVKLEVPARKIGLKPGTKVTGFAFTQFGGTVNWDRLGVTSSSDPANDPNWSWQVWKSQDTQKRNKLLPEHLRRQLQGRNPDQWSPEESETVFALWMRNVYLGARDLIDQLSREKGPLQAQVTAIEKSAPITFVMADLEKPRQSFVMLRGAYDQKGDRVTRQVPAFLPKLKKQPAGQDYNRLDLADWLVNGAHPLTARVTVNRFWQQFFGTGLVKTSEDFGSQGAAPTHPELLDWLAVQFVEDGWDMKRLVKRIVTSHAYRQNTRVHPDVRAIDPENLLLSRGPRLRLDAEVIRDQALFVSGLLVPRFGGPGVKPYQPPNIWEPVGFGNSNTRYYKQGTGDDLYRRSIYTFLKRTAPPPFMSSFDAPNREQSCSRRGRSNTPLQALQLMNDVQHVEAARCLAERMLKEGGATPEKRIHWCWQVVTSRQPNTDEIKIVRETLQRHLDRFTADTPAAAELIAFGESQADESTNPAELAAYTLIANLILNLDETVSKN